MTDLAGRLAHRVQMTTDGYRPYLEAVESAFGGDIDYATLVKLYGSDPDAEKRYRSSSARTPKTSSKAKAISAVTGLLSAINLLMPVSSRPRTIASTRWLQPFSASAEATRCPGVRGLVSSTIGIIL
jgi:hypothetical protein